MRAAPRRAAPPLSVHDARALLAERLRERWPEIERAALSRLYGVSEAPERPDPDYADGLRAATSAALDYLLAGVERGEVDALQPPLPVLAQARLAARNRVGLDTVVRRCFAGHALFGDFLMGELERFERLAPDLPKRLLRTQASLFDRMLAAVIEEYLREVANRADSLKRRRAWLIERLLAGEPLEAAELGYDYELEGHHLGMLAKGAGTAEALRDLASALDRRLLTLEREDGVTWAWLGGRDPIDLDGLLRLASSAWPSQARLALGEPGEGPEGWRLSHRQAAAALPIALRGPNPVTRYADVALLAAVLKDELLASSLRRMYLEPLEDERDGGEVLRETLRAYFKAGRNVSSTAAVLGVKRETVTNRLRSTEDRLGRFLGLCDIELELALRLHELPAGQIPLSGG